ncbi:nuclear transport factor 2 family protein [Janibacter anophelis]|uniref:nuclear transport factor 2 family protein n=1 Tax=Janibacter anophelis TaxID=319054 RepID=UPI003F7E301B
MGIGEDFAHAVAAKDRAALERLLAPDVDFKGLTPGRLWEATGPDEVAEVIFGSWFERSDTIESLVAVETGAAVGDTERVSYRLDLSNDRGPQVVEQQAYHRCADGRITHLRVLCSGFRPR